MKKLWLVTLVGALLCVGAGVAGASIPPVPAASFVPPTSGEMVPGSGRFGLDASALEPRSFAEYVLEELAQEREGRAGSYSWWAGEGEQGEPEQAAPAPPYQPSAPERRLGLLENGAWPDRDHFHLFASLHVERGPPIVLPSFTFEYPRAVGGEKPLLGDFWISAQEPQVAWNEWFTGGSVVGSFHGAWTDPVTGFAYHRARWYDPRNAAFLSEDPLGDIDSPNLYAFVKNSPFNGVDPLGENCRNPQTVEEARGCDRTSAEVTDRTVRNGAAYLRGIGEGLNSMPKRLLQAPGDLWELTLAASEEANYALSHPMQYLGDVFGSLKELPGEMANVDSEELAGWFGSASSDIILGYGVGRLVPPGTSPRVRSPSSAETPQLPYAHLENHPSVGPRKPYTQTQKKKIRAANRERNAGVLRDDVTGEVLVEPLQHKRGVTPPLNEAQVDHVYTRADGGPNSYLNAELRSRADNLKKGDKNDHD